MAKKRKTRKITAKNKTIKKAIKSSKAIELSLNHSLKQNLFDQLKLGESYVSLVLGAVVVVVVSIIFFIFIKEGNMRNSKRISPQVSVTKSPARVVAESKTYVLQDGEGLWDVAVKFYGDGFRWTEIAKANHLEDTADYVDPGTKLIIPNLK